MLAPFFTLSEIKYFNVFELKLNKILMSLRLGIAAIAKPKIISNEPTTLRYHFEGTLKSKASVKGKTLAYFTYSFLWNNNNYKCDD